MYQLQQFGITTTSWYWLHRINKKIIFALFSPNNAMYLHRIKCYITTINNIVVMLHLHLQIKNELDNKLLTDARLSLKTSKSKLIHFVLNLKKTYIKR